MGEDEVRENIFEVDIHVVVRLVLQVSLVLKAPGNLGVFALVSYLLPSLSLLHLGDI